MKTILTKKIDGFDIITGFGTPVIDPFATREIVGPVLFETAETKAIISKNKEVEEIKKMVKNAIESAQLAIRNGDKKGVDKYNEDYKRHNIMIDEKMAELIPLKTAYEEKRKSLMVENAIYFEPKAGENVITDEKAVELSKKIMALGENEKISKDGRLIADYRSKVFYLKTAAGWTEQKIDALSVTPEKGSILQEDLTPEQQAEISEEANKKRIAEMSDTDRATEKNSIIDSLAGQAANMRSKLEIQGATASKALADSKKWYEAEVKKVELKYT